MIYRREIAVAVLTLLALAGVLGLINRVSDAQSGAQSQFVYDAVRNAALTCYAVEGAYPEDLEYLREHYGLAYDQARYRVRYEAFSSNLLPEIHVTELKGEALG